MEILSGSEQVQGRASMNSEKKFRDPYKQELFEQLRNYQHFNTDPASWCHLGFVTLICSGESRFKVRLRECVIFTF